MRLFALQEIAKCSTGLIVDGLLSPELAARIEPERERLVSELYRDVESIQAAFDIPMSLLAAPIGEDYLRAYDFLAKEARPRSQSSIRVQAVTDAQVEEHRWGRRSSVSGGFLPT